MEKKQMSKDKLKAQLKTQIKDDKKNEVKETRTVEKKEKPKKVVKFVDRSSEIDIDKIKSENDKSQSVLKKQETSKNKTSTTDVKNNSKPETRIKAQNNNKKSVQKSKKPSISNEMKPTSEREYINVENTNTFPTGVKGFNAKTKHQNSLTSKYSKKILVDEVMVSTQNYTPDPDKHIIELKNVRKSYVSGDLETQILKGIDITLDRGDFIVILGPSGSGKTTFLNIISGLDKVTEGDAFILGSNLSLLKDSDLTKFRRKHVGFIFQQYNLLTNLTAKENAEVGYNLSSDKDSGMNIEEIFVTIGMKEQMNKYPSQMSGGQQQRVSIARALAKNPNILFADEPTGALDEEMGRKVLEILVKVNKEYKTTVIVVTHNPNIAKIANTIIHIKNGLIDQLEHNSKPANPQTIEWS